MCQCLELYHFHVLAFGCQADLALAQAQRIGAEHFYPTKGTAVDAYLKATGTEWVDWEEVEEDAPKA